MLALAWAWFLARIGIEWSRHAQFERRRIEEARLLVETMCSTALGANLAHEFAKCEDAHVTVANGGRVVWLRAFEKTVRTVSLQIAHQVGSVTVGALAHALVLSVASAGLIVAATLVAAHAGDAAVGAAERGLQGSCPLLGTMSMSMYVMYMISQPAPAF